MNEKQRTRPRMKALGALLLLIIPAAAAAAHPGGGLIALGADTVGWSCGAGSSLKVSAACAGRPHDCRVIMYSG